MSSLAHEPPLARASTPTSSRYYACALLDLPAGVATDEALEVALRLCRQVSERVEAVALTAVAAVAAARQGGAQVTQVAQITRVALLDLGCCPAPEAEALARELLARLEAEALRCALGVGASQTIATLAALVTLQAAGWNTLQRISAEQQARFLQDLPLTPLICLPLLFCHATWQVNRPRRAAMVEAAQVVERLRRYGLRTLGQVARLDARDPQALRRQFGAPLGAQLAALCQGRDLRALQPTPLPLRLTARLRFEQEGQEGQEGQEASGEQALAALPALAERLARRLAARERQGRDLRVRVVWASGAQAQARRRLARPLSQPQELAQAAHALLITLLATPPTSGERAISALALTLGDLAPRLPARAAPLFALASSAPRVSERAKLAERLERLAVEVGAPLARRYGAPALFRLATTQPDAILPEERTRLVALDSADSSESAQIGRQAALAPAAGRDAADGADGAPEPWSAASATPPQPHWW